VLGTRIPVARPAQDADGLWSSDPTDEASSSRGIGGARA